MLYVWIDDNGILCTTFELASVPEKYKNNVVVFENLTIHDVDKLYVENGEIKVKTIEEILEKRKQDLLNLLRITVYNVLSQTDWVVIKCQELGLEIQKEYPEICRFRQTIRMKNQKIEEMIVQATTLEELSTIEQMIANIDIIDE